MWQALLGIQGRSSALLRNLAHLQGDLGDDVLRAHLVDNALAIREIEALLERRSRPASYGVALTSG